MKNMGEGGFRYLTLGDLVIPHIQVDGGLDWTGGEL